MGVAALASCAPRAAPPPAEPEQPRPQAPRPEPVSAPPPAAADWQDAPLASGDWSYSGEGASSSASYGETGRPLFVLRCEAGRQLSLARPGIAGATNIVIRTTSAARSLAAGPRQGGLTALLPATDAFLDEIAFSRGRFTVEAAGAPMLVLPTWPEFARVVEDCRD
jgi:hypothetical protein